MTGETIGFYEQHSAHVRQKEAQRDTHRAFFPAGGGEASAAAWVSSMLIAAAVLYFIMVLALY